MTEEAILKCLDILQSNISKSYFAQNVSCCEMRALVESKKIIEAIQQYRTIGTIEECREAREKRGLKAPLLNGCEEKTHYKCQCGYIFLTIYANGHRVGNTPEFCERCGQAIDWSDLYDR